MPFAEALHHKIFLENISWNNKIWNNKNAEQNGSRNQNHVIHETLISGENQINLEPDFVLSHIYNPAVLFTNFFNGSKVLLEENQLGN